MSDFYRHFSEENPNGTFTEAFPRWVPGLLRKESYGQLIIDPDAQVGRLSSPRHSPLVIRIACLQCVAGKEDEPECSWSQQTRGLVLESDASVLQ